METLVLVTNIVKWVLISVTVLTNSTLVWKILRRRSLYTLFNLGWCLFFFIAGSCFPFIINEYINLLNDMLFHPDTPSPGRCYTLYNYRMLTLQITKVFFLNLGFRYIIVRFSHYGLGLSNSFSMGGMKHWVLRFTYFTLLLTYIGIACFNNVVKSYKEEMMKNVVKGRICLLLRFVYMYIYLYMLLIMMLSAS